MLQNKEYYGRLFQKYIHNECNPEEVKEILDYIHLNSSDRFLIEQIKASFEGMLQQNILPEQAEWKEKIRQKLADNVNAAPKIVPFYKKWLPRVAAALIIFTAGSIAFYFFNSKKKVNDFATGKKVPAMTIPPVEILPGKNKALLTLANGSVIVLDDVNNGKVASEGSTIVNKKNNQLIYDASANAVEALPEITFNTIATPNGGQFQVVLSDGTKVWLNAASTIRFPTVFKGATRNVELTGEGYFEVAKDALKPFVVKLNSAEIEVLGTHFNVMGYDNESSLKTTLLEGAVKINHGKVSKVLKPGQQAEIRNASETINVQDGDIEEAVAWKNGSFLFVNEDLKSIMRQLSRWYNIEVSYEGKEKVRLFSGEVSRNVTLTQALKILDFTNVKFRIDEKKIVVIF